MPGPAEIIPLPVPDCGRAAPYLSALAAGDHLSGTGAPQSELAAAAAHVARCLRCQAEMTTYRRILRHLRALRHDDVPTPPGALAAVLTALHSAALDERRAGSSRAVRAAYVGGITVVTAAATTAGLLVWMSRRRLGLAETG
jgi:hypothetical protein